MNLKFEKFERKYNFSIPDSYRILMTDMGDEYTIGNCEFFPVDDFINNNLRLGGAMEAGLFPFGCLGNGDCFCFLKYGENPGEYYVVLWLSETYNYVVLNSTFDNFLYNCVIQEYKTLLYPDEYMAEGTRDEIEESTNRINSICSLFDFDLEGIEGAKDEKSLDGLLISRDPFAIQLVCGAGSSMLSNGDAAGAAYLRKAMLFCPEYTAPYYILGKYLLGRDRQNALRLLFQGAMAPLAASGYSYWEEDNIGIPFNVMDEIFDILMHNEDNLQDEYRGSTFMNFIRMGQPYNDSFRFILAEKYIKDGDFASALRELNNVLLLTKDLKLKIEILEMLIPVYERAGYVWASGVCRRDIKYIKGLKQL